MAATAMRSVAFAFTCLACVGYARRVQTTSRDTLQALDSDTDEQSNLALMLLGAALQVPTHAQIRNRPAVMKEKSAAAVSPVGTIFEFVDGKHTMVGIVTDIVSKTKEKNPPESKCSYEVRDKAAKTHKVSPKSVHIAFAPDDKVGMKDYIEIASIKPLDFGIDPDVLELAWELLADESEVSLEDIMNQIDPDICETPTGRYRAFRLLSSDMGKIFFKRLHATDYHHVTFKPKSPEAIQSTKEKWCSDGADGEATSAEEWCML